MHRSQRLWATITKTSQEQQSDTWTRCHARIKTKSNRCVGQPSSNLSMTTSRLDEPTSRSTEGEAADYGRTRRFTILGPLKRGGRPISRSSKCSDFASHRSVVRGLGYSYNGLLQLDIYSFIMRICKKIVGQSYTLGCSTLESTVRTFISELLAAVHALPSLPNQFLDSRHPSLL